MPKLFLFLKFKIASPCEQRLIFEIDKIEPEILGGGQKGVRDEICGTLYPDLEIGCLRKIVKYWKKELNATNKKFDFYNLVLRVLMCTDLDLKTARDNYFTAMEKLEIVQKKYLAAKQKLESLQEKEARKAE